MLGTPQETALHFTAMHGDYLQQIVTLESHDYEYRYLTALKVRAQPFRSTTTCTINIAYRSNHSHYRHKLDSDLVRNSASKTQGPRAEGEPGSQSGHC